MTKIFKIILIIIKWLLICFLAIIVIFLLYRLIVRKINLNNSIKQNKISEIREIKLGNYNQKILLEGKSSSLPLLVVLHGGPMTPIAFGNGYRGAYPKLTENFIVVEWDQYGCGINKGNYEDLSINDYVVMGEDLIKYLKQEFSNNEIYLFGMSWGSALGIYIVHDISEYIDKFISYGTLINMEISYKYLGELLLNENLSSKDKEKVNYLLSQKYTYDNIIELQKISLNYGLSVQGMDKMDSFIYKSLFKLLTSPDYSLKDVFGVLNNNVSESKIYNEINDMDVTDMFDNITIPLYIIQGKYDNQTPHYIISDYLKNHNNAHYLELENSGHFPTNDDFDKVIKYIVELKDK